MILLSTRIKLSQEEKKAYRVFWPEFVVSGVTVPAAKEDFSSASSAKKAANRWMPHCAGVLKTIDPMDGF